MKKYIFFILVVSFLTSCQSDTISNIDSGVKVISNCCKDISNAGAEGCTLLKQDDKKSDETPASTNLFPAYSWDAKQMFW